MLRAAGLLLVHQEQGSNNLQRQLDQLASLAEHSAVALT
jgi:hypothetical protein